MKTENWNGHEIRFVSIDKEWWAVAKDVAEALGYKHTPHMTRYIDEQDMKKCDVLNSDATSKHARKSQEVIVLSEFGIYDAVFRSSKPEAKQFKRWVFEVIKTLREQTGLEGFQVFRLMDKEHQKEAMSYLSHALKHPVRVNFIKANTIANKAVSIAHGHSKMLKKADMTPQMLVDRQKILEEIVDLMSVQDKYNLDISISQTIYNKDKQTN
ncbi:Bro-N domain-containing protein [Marinilactibacillus psychrotolerans]|uniref:BRO-N domain-containing protein n=1 Tax=Marinilactibacillus psychrotolerans TaxID=191770 RepID=UPI003883B2A5